MTAKQPQQTPAQQQAVTAAQRLAGLPSATPTRRDRRHRRRGTRVRVTLLALLNRDLAALEDDTSKINQVVRNSATRVLRTLVTRYGINLADDS